jgi:hypothetical protein
LVSLAFGGVSTFSTAYKASAAHFLGEVKHMGRFSNETIKWLSIGLGIIVALYLLFVMIPMAQVPLYADGVRKSGLRIGIEGRLHFLGII